MREAIILADLFFFRLLCFAEASFPASKSSSFIMKKLCTGVRYSHLTAEGFRKYNFPPETIFCSSIETVLVCVNSHSRLSIDAPVVRMARSISSRACPRTTSGKSVRANRDTRNMRIGCFILQNYLTLRLSTIERAKSGCGASFPALCEKLSKSGVDSSKLLTKTVSAFPLRISLLASSSAQSKDSSP